MSEDLLVVLRLIWFIGLFGIALPATSCWNIAKRNCKKEHKWIMYTFIWMFMFSYFNNAGVVACKKAIVFFVVFLIYAWLGMIIGAV
ncbi:hypothetical protein [Marinobacterium arenosum]|uniref:hypothetical protein n=1 Tax=Marinobacterium arenosum TaxID=2862496 RepID=UPI001C96B71F|nr:hypothetical protein [Marinobacterium arenosum]MBY4675399.1 hypothetical protein [Marinobacterium arenosum]